MIRIFGSSCTDLKNEIKFSILINFVEIDKFEDEIFLFIILDNRICDLIDSNSILLLL